MVVIGLMVMIDCEAQDALAQANSALPEYLLFRQINLVRLALRRMPSGANVTQILTELGVNELGRFSASYKKLFGELPLETRRRARELSLLDS